MEGGRAKGRSIQATLADGIVVTAVLVLVAVGATLWLDRIGRLNRLADTVEHDTSLLAQQTDSVLSRAEIVLSTVTFGWEVYGRATAERARLTFQTRMLPEGGCILLYGPAADILETTCRPARRQAMDPAEFSRHLDNRAITLLSGDPARGTVSFSRTAQDAQGRVLGVVRVVFDATALLGYDGSIGETREQAIVGVDGAILATTPAWARGKAGNSMAPDINKAIRNDDLTTVSTIRRDGYIAAGIQLRTQPMIALSETSTAPVLWEWWRNASVAAAALAVALAGVSVLFTRLRRAERGRAQARFEAERERALLNIVIANAPVGIWMMAPDGTYPMVNRTFADWVGWGTGAPSITPEEIRSCQVSDATAAGQDASVSTDEVVTFVDGAPHTLQVVKQRVLDPSGALAGVIGVGLDITARKRMEEELRATAGRLDALLKSAPVGIVIVDSNRRIMVVNPTMEQMFQRRADELIGASSRLLHRSDEEFDSVGRRLYPQVMRGGTAGDEVPMTRGDGTSFWARIIGHRVSAEDPSLGIVWIVDDISARKKAEQALEASLKFQRILIDTVPIPIFVKDRASRFIDANTSFLKGVGLNRVQLFGGASGNAALADLGCTGRGAGGALPAAPGTQVYEARVRLADGLDRDVEVSQAVFFDAHGDPAGVVGAVIDLTQRKQAEQALRERQQFFEQIFVGSRAVKLLLDPADGSIVDANPAASDFYGHPLDRLRTMRIADINIMPEGEIRSAMDLAVKRGRDHFHFRHRLASGEVRDVEAYGSPINVGGRTLLLALIHDITERRRAEEELQVQAVELQRQAVELHRSNAELEAFAYAASHDLRQPLRSITSYLTLLERDLEGTLDEDGRQYLGFARDGARRMDHLIVDLLEYSRVGRKTKPFAVVPATEIIETALLNLEAAVQEAGATVAVAPALPVLWGDDNELMRLFQNLIGNAIKYRAPDRRPEVQVACSADEDDWHFTVADNGIGIGPDYLDRIFGIFQRLHTREQYEGTGIGLAVCKKIVEHHRGRIWAESELGRGSTFHVLLPRQEGTAQV